MTSTKIDLPADFNAEPPESDAVREHVFNQGSSCRLAGRISIAAGRQ